MKFLRIFILFSFSLCVSSQTIQFGTLGGGFSNQTYNAVRTLFYDSLSNKLYAGGQFNLTEGKPVWGAAVWDGSSWDSLQGGLTKYPHQPVTINTAGPVVWKITRYLDKIYYLGAFDWVNGKNQYNMAVWNGSSWEYPQQFPLTSNSFIYDMKVHNGILYACGDFTAIGNVACNYVAKFDGVSWQPVGNIKEYFGDYEPAQMNAIEVFNNEIYVGGYWVDSSLSESRNIAKFDGSKWRNVGQGIRQGGLNGVLALQTYNNKLYIGGYFSKTDEIPGEGLVVWNGNSYERAAAFDLDRHGNIFKFVLHKNKLVALGGFRSFGEYDGWAVLFIDSLKECTIAGLAQTFTSQPVCAWTSIESMNDTLVIGGQFDFIGNVPAKNIAIILNYESKMNCAYTSVEDVFLEENTINLYPNPINNQLKLIYHGEMFGELELHVLNSFGQIVLTTFIRNREEILDFSKLQSGLFFLQFKNSKNELVSKKIIKK